MGLLHQFRVIDIDARLPSERFGHDMLTVAIIITELRVVRASEGQPSFQPSLFFFNLCGIDALFQLL